MHHLSVVEGHPVDDFIFGLAPCFEADVMEALDLERSEQGLGHGVVPALSLVSPNFWK